MSRHVIIDLTPSLRHGEARVRQREEGLVRGVLRPREPLPGGRGGLRRPRRLRRGPLLWQQQLQGGLENEIRLL